MLPKGDVRERARGRKWPKAIDEKHKLDMTPLDRINPDQLMEAARVDNLPDLWYALTPPEESERNGQMLRDDPARFSQRVGFR